MTNIVAKVIAHSICARTRKSMVTFELEYPRFIHSELMTHRVFSRNAMSSRAVPIEKMIEQVLNNPAHPEHWGLNQAGMQAKVEAEGVSLLHAKWGWSAAAMRAVESAEQLNSLGLHKQIVNRVLEPFQRMKTVVTSTEWNNWFWLRDHEDAQPEIKVLAGLMREALDKSVPVELQPGDWHVPYYNDGVWVRSQAIGAIDTWKHGEDPTWKNVVIDKFGHTLEHALAISSSCCAQVSFRQLDDTLEKAQRIYERLVLSKPVHASPFEHQGTPIQESAELLTALDLEDPRSGYSVVNLSDRPDTWQVGITHIDKHYQFWSGNLCGFIQHRQLIADNVQEG